MTRAEHEALTLVRGYAAAGRIIVSRHALQRMRQRGATYSDVRAALTAATQCEADGPKWKVTGPDLDADDLTCVVVLGDGVLVVTVF